MVTGTEVLVAARQGGGRHDDGGVCRGTLAACAFAAVLLAVVRSGGVKSALATVITTALGTAG